VELYNNTFYDCGSRGTSDSGTYTLYTPTRLRNNVAYQIGSEVYVGKNSNSPSGSNNLWYGVGAGPSQTTSNVNADPLFANRTGYDFHIGSSSPAKDVGVTITTASRDKDGITRPQGSAYDLGAYEYFAGTIVTSNPCDLNSDGVVNSTDVQLATNQALGTNACGTADLSGDGTCTVVDVQRVINASLGQACRVGL
jgi:hypothetical protein